MVDGNLKLRDDVSLDHEAAAELDLRVEVTDSGGHVITHDLRLGVSDVDEAPTGLVGETLTVEEATAGATVGYVAAIDPEGGAVSYEVSDARFEVVGNELRLKPGEALDHETEPSVALQLTATDEGGNSTTETMTVDVTDLAEVARPMGIETGFQFEFFDHGRSVRSTEDVDWSADPTHREMGATVDFDATRGSFRASGAEDEFAVRVTGRIDIDEEGSHAFRVFADDGVRVFIDGVEVVEDDVPHGPRYSNGSIDLAPGSHEVEIRYFENRGKAALRLEMKGPGEADWSLVEASDTPVVEQAGSIPLGIDSGDVGEMHAIDLHGLPHGSVVMDGEHAVISDGGPVDLRGWNHDLIEISPPGDFSGTMELSVRAQGRDADDRPFESAEAISIDVLPDADAGSQGHGEEAMDVNGGTNWTETLDDPGSDGAAAHDAPVESGPQFETGDEYMHGYERGDL